MKIKMAACNRTMMESSAAMLPSTPRLPATMYRLSRSPICCPYDPHFVRFKAAHGQQVLSTCGIHLAKGK